MSCGCNQIVPCGCQSALSGCSGGSGSGGSFIFNRDLIPISDNVFSIGSPTKRVRNLFLGTDLILSCGSAIRQNTVINLDECITTITGAGFPITTRGAVVQISGNESALNGGITLETGDEVDADFSVTATRNGIFTFGGDYTLTVGDDALFSAIGDVTVQTDATMTLQSDLAMLLNSTTTLTLTAGTSAALNALTTFTVNTNSLARWIFEADGDLAGDSTNGGNFIITAANKGILIDATSLDADVGSPAGVDVVAAGGTTKGLRTISNTSVATSIGIFGYKTRSTGTDANTIVQSGDNLLSITALGADGASYQNSSQILFKVDAAPGVGDMPGAIAFLSSSDGAATLLERWRINSAGNILQDATNGGNLIITKSLTGVLLGATSLDADVGNQARLAIVGGLATGFGATFFSIGNNTTSLAIGGYKTRSTGTDANTIVQSGDELFNIYALGADGTDYEQAARITFTVDGPPGNNDMPGAVNFYTTPDGSNGTLLRWSILSTGNLNGDASSGGDLVFNRSLRGPRITNVQVGSAAGASQATATLITSNSVLITGGSGGIRLPVPNGTGHTISVYNSTGSSINLYPATGAAIGNAAANAPLVVASMKSAVVWSYDGTGWLYMSSA